MMRRILMILLMAITMTAVMAPLSSGVCPRPAPVQS
jgi:hypothetical protein